MTRLEAVVLKRTAAAILVKIFRRNPILGGQVVWLPKQLVREWPGLNLLDVEDWILRKKEKQL